MLVRGWKKISGTTEISVEPRAIANKFPPSAHNVSWRTNTHSQGRNHPKRQCLHPRRSTTTSVSGAPVVIRGPRGQVLVRGVVIPRSPLSSALARLTPNICFNCETVKAPISAIASATFRGSSHSGTATAKHRICEDARNDPEMSNFHLRLAQNS